MNQTNTENFSAAESQEIKHQLLTLVCTEAITKLRIFQRGLRVNAAILPPASKTAKPALNSSKEKINSSKKSSLTEEDMKSMPDAKLLNHIKLDRELDMLIGVYTAAIDEITGNRADDAQSLFLMITALQESDNEVDLKTQQLRQQQLALQSLKTKIETEHNETEARLQNMDDKIATLRHNLRNVRRLNDLEFDLVERWEANRYTQATIVCTSMENALLQDIEELNRRLVGEARITCEVEKFNAKQFAEYRDSIAEWKTKYANEMAKVTAETKEHEKRIMELAKTRERHEQTYAERLAFVREYLAQKAEEQRLYEQQMHRVECAIKLQAWWRGVMVRRGLGPYKKKAKKGKKGKGKGK